MFFVKSTCFCSLTFLWLWFLFYPFGKSNNHVVQRLLVCASFCSKLNGGQVQVCIVFLRKKPSCIYRLAWNWNEHSQFLPNPALLFFFFFLSVVLCFQSIVLYDQVLNFKVLVASETEKVLVVCLHISWFPPYSTLVAWVVDAGRRLTLDDSCFGLICPLSHRLLNGNRFAGAEALPLWSVHIKVGR